MAGKEETPLMQQYNSIKSKHPDALLLFRVGDFYETFNEDAVRAARILGIVLTKRSNGAAADMDLAGFPHHSLETYLPKLVRAGLRVAICDQLEDPKTTKKIVKRGVTEVVTPGVNFSDKILDQKTNNFLAAIFPASDDTRMGLALADASTGEFMVAEGSPDYIDKLLQSFAPAEVLFPKPRQRKLDERYGARFNLYGLEDWVFQDEYAREVLQRQFGTVSLKGFGVDDWSYAIVAAGAAMHYLQQTQQIPLAHLRGLSRIEENSYVWLDRFTIRNLELVSSPHEGARTLLNVMDHTVTAMGGRLLRRWLLMPLKDKQRIEQRLDVVSYLVNTENAAHQLEPLLKEMGDLERLSSRIALRKLGPREALMLRRSVKALTPLITWCNETGHVGLKSIAAKLDPCLTILAELERAINDDPPALINKGGVIRKGFSTELDEIRAIAYEGKDYLLRIQQEESSRTGISSLKIAYNNVFGYYIEVTNSHKHKVPVEWTRKQTLANAERYITEELKQYEEKILGAEEKIQAIEERLYTELLAFLSSFIDVLQRNAALIARLDVLFSFARAARKQNYCCPEISEDCILDIRDGRHPVLEQQLPVGETYIPNDVLLNPDEKQIIMITGPNMSGKSAILRQTALITLLAQCGSFVPAAAAHVGIVDKIFTRVGASDNISQGESTFMVEMNETASILHNLSGRSLVLLDEIGRGTSTYDGISIAWAIAEYLHEQPHARARTLFATHYHELNEMAERFSRIRNYNVAIRENGNQVLFLRKLVPGGSEHSFGIHVARMAGMPESVIRKANEMLETLENAHSNNGLLHAEVKKQASDRFQLSFFQLDDPLLEQIREEILKTDVNTLTPVEALLRLHEIRKLILKEKVVS
jgi:DNA mismatch repair protein MutS